MEFLKRNWMKLVAVILFSAVAVFALITSINAFSTASALRDIPEAMRPALPGAPHEVALSQANAGAFTYLAIFLSCFFVIAAIKMKMFKLNRKISGIVLIAGSVVALTIFVTGIALGSDFISMLSQNVDTARQGYEAASGTPGEPLFLTGYRAARAAHITQISQVVIFIIVFGVAPLAMGIKKLFCSSCKESK
ncbi:MAG: hypothetical protein FWE45_04995 [Firmicutes bacterium]|nr:hypothetical protein [Bacillota bacterium]